MGLQHFLVVMVLLFGGSGCSTAPEFPLPHETDEVRRATQVMQEREQEVAALRTEMASTRIAAAKQAAELDELRGTVIQLRQESRDAQQAHLETKRTLDARQVELAAMKTERDQLAQVPVQSTATDRQLESLQETVASLSRELTQLKQTLVVTTPSLGSKSSRRGRTEKQTSRWAGVPQHSGEPIIAALSVIQDDRAKPTWITVQPGQNLQSLAKQYKTTIATLRAINNLTSDPLRPGQAIRLP